MMKKPYDVPAAEEIVIGSSDLILVLASKEPNEKLNTLEEDYN